MAIVPHTPYILHGEVDGFEDRLVIATKKFRKGKRVGKDCPLTHDEIRAYVKNGPVDAVRQIRTNRSCSLREALTLLNQARYTPDQMRLYMRDLASW